MRLGGVAEGVLFGVLSVVFDGDFGGGVVVGGGLVCFWWGVN